MVNYVKLNKKVPPEVISSITGIDDLSKLADSIAAHMTLKINEKQNVLELLDIKKRCEYLIKAMEGELDILHVEKKIRSKTIFFIIFKLKLIYKTSCNFNTPYLTLPKIHFTINKLLSIG